jgi:CDP-glucose 4,6-dehydratase
MEPRMAFRDAYKGMKVLVTGHTGFKGSWLSAWLTALGAKVFGVALNPRSDRDNFVVAGLGKKVNHHIRDIRNRIALQGIVAEVKPDMVFHLAAQSLVSASFDNAPETFETNVMGTVNMLEAIRRTDSIKSAVLITSDKCYRNVEWERGYRESDALGGLDPYGASKSCAEMAIASYRKSFFQNPGSPRIASVRAGNVIGGGDWSDNRIVPDTVRALLAGVPVGLRNPGSTRPWQFVLEPLSGYLWLGANMLEGREDLDSSWNFGPDESTVITVEELTKMIVRNWGRGSTKNLSAGNHFHEAVRLRLDCSKARHELKWQPTLTVSETVDFTISWYKNWERGGDMYEYDMETIRKFSEKALARNISWAIR